MEIVCPGCTKKLNIPDERLHALKSNVTIPCPSCKGDIEVDIQSKKSPSATFIHPEGQLTGKELKEAILKSVGDLPPMPQVAQKARQVISNPDSNFKDLAKVIETDQAIAAKVLRMSNSAYYGSAGNISSIQQASVFLGTKALMELLNLACASGPLGKSLNGYDLESGDLWKHSLAVAAGSRIISRNIKPDLADDAFSAGLIHDVGKLILDSYIHEKKEAFNRVVREGKVTFPSAEKAVLGFDHAEIASEVCDKWKIPQHLSLAIRYHHNPLESEKNDLTYILHVADVTAMMTGIGGGLDGMLYRIDEKALDFLGFGHMDITLLMSEIAEYVSKTVESV
ncbi:MAG: HDOD domain-containing protein [Deltaproteobacteria bacterium]|nr:HDOD domain-containing protein [Deltaproteobacteria bacterium]